MRGIVIGQPVPTQLVVQASEQEVAAFTLGQGVGFGPTLHPSGKEAAISALMQDGLLYGANGAVIGHIQAMSVETERDQIDVTTHGDVGKTYVYGLPVHTLHLTVRA